MNFGEELRMLAFLLQTFLALQISDRFITLNVVILLCCREDFFLKYKYYLH
jgi:hypothetical protein